MYSPGRRSGQNPKQPFSALGEGELQVANWLGRLGAVVGNGLIYWGFGIAALVLSHLVLGFGLENLLAPVYKPGIPGQQIGFSHGVFIHSSFVFLWIDFLGEELGREYYWTQQKAFMGFLVF
jgi:hypothetical protein